MSNNVNDTHANGNMEQTVQDRTLECVDCGNDFVFTRGEQDFYTERGLRDPKRCKPCRAAKRAERKQ